MIGVCFLVAGAAALPDQMEVDDMPSSSSGPSPRPLSDCSSSSEGDIATLSVKSFGGRKSRSSSNSEVLYQNCVKPSLVKAMFGKADNNVCSTRIRIPQRAKKKSEQMNLSDDEDEESDSFKPEIHSRNQLNDSSSMKNAWLGKCVPCHCPACCSCRHSNESINFASWPRKRTCPLQMSLRMCRADIPIAVKLSPAATSREPKLAEARRALWSPSGDITMSNLSLHADQTWAAKKRMQGELQQVRRCCCPRRIEYGRKSLSLPAGASLDSNLFDQLDKSYSAIERNSDVDCMVRVDSLHDHDPLVQNCRPSTGCNQDVVENRMCNHDGRDGHPAVWNQGVDGSVFKQRMEVSRVFTMLVGAGQK